MVCGVMKLDYDNMRVAALFDGRRKLMNAPGLGYAVILSRLDKKGRGLKEKGRYYHVALAPPLPPHPAMVICTFLDAFDLKGKTIIPFFTYDATTYLNESMQKIYRLTPHSRHIPATLPEDLDPGDITTPGRADDEGIDMPGSAAGVKTWLKKINMLP